MSATTLIWLFAIGAAIAMTVLYYNARFLGNLVRKLIEIDATSPASALTLEELNIKLSPAIKYSLRPGTSFSETVLKTEDNRYYIAPDKLEMAKSKYRGKDTTIVFLLLCFVILAISAYALTQFFPDLLTKVGNQFSEIFGSGGK